MTLGKPFAISLVLICGYCALLALTPPTATPREPAIVLEPTGETDRAVAQAVRTERAIDTPTPSAKRNTEQTTPTASR